MSPLRQTAIYLSAGVIRGLQLPNLPAGKFLPPDVLPVLKTEGLFPVSAICSSSCTVARRVRGPPSRREHQPPALCALLLLVMEVTSRSVVLPPEEHHLLAGVRAAARLRRDHTPWRGLAQEFHVSTFHLAHAFKAAYGYAPLPIHHAAPHRRGADPASIDGGPAHH